MESAKTTQDLAYDKGFEEGFFELSRSLAESKLLGQVADEDRTRFYCGHKYGTWVRDEFEYLRA